SNVPDLQEPRRPAVVVRVTGSRAMTKKEITKSIAEKADVPIATVQQIVQALFDNIIETLVEEGGIELRNFGIFNVSRRPARTAGTPKTGERVDVPPGNVVGFKAGRALQQGVQRTNDAIVGVEPMPHGEGNGR